MKAIVHHRYGSPDVLELQDVDIPPVRDNEVLVRVRAASVNLLDWHLMRGTPYTRRTRTGLRRPGTTRLGVDLAGQVEAVGRKVTQFQPGDDVFGVRRGAFGEYVCAPEWALMPKPANLTFAQAAAVPVAGCTALQALRVHGQIGPGQKVLINGASGGVGTFAVQIAGAVGAEVTAVCSTRNASMVRWLGAGRVIDYTQEDFTRGRERYDLIVDLVGNHALSACRRVLSPEGVYVVAGGRAQRWTGPIGRSLKARLLSWFVDQKLVPLEAAVTRADLAILKTMIEAGRIMPVVDRCYALSEVPEALRYLGQGHARGKVVIVLEDPCADSFSAGPGGATLALAPALGAAAAIG
jgi:NADPH:quinone reductase-like Zn-dependent oxidoreductase